MPKKVLFFFLLCLNFAPVLWSAPSTVTNNGNIEVRVQYKTPDGQYEDLGYLKPGESAEVPGGVEKVRIVRDPGEWAAPLKPGETLDVSVKQGDKEAGRMTWYGGKVFFDGLTEGNPPAVAVTAPAPAVQTPEPPKAEPQTPAQPEVQPEPEAENTPAKTPQNWPWLGGVSDYIFILMLMSLWAGFLFLMVRSWARPKYYIDGDWVPSNSLGWGWGWKSGACGRYALMNGLLLGVVFSALAVWGHGNYSSGAGFIPKFGQDLYSFPYFLLSGFLQGNAPGMPDLAFIFLFWTSLGTLCGGLAAFLPIKLLYSMPFLCSALPFLLLMRGCAGGQSFAYDGGYGGGELAYPPAFAGAGFFISMITSALLDWADPYEEMSYDEEDDVEDAVWDFFHGNPYPLAFFLGGGCLASFYGAAAYGGMDFAVDYYFDDIPLMLGVPGIPPMAMIILFWMGLFGGLGCLGYKNPSRMLFYGCMAPAFISLLMLTCGNYPQRRVVIDRPLVYIGEYAIEEEKLTKLIQGEKGFVTPAEELRAAPKAEAKPDTTLQPKMEYKLGAGFGDDFKTLNRFRYSGTGGDTQFEESQTTTGEHHDHHDPQEQQ